jgi:DNA-binding winged helix-turn-helix (wHTH) protein/TolB-like protein/Tfp pilus assembly protein PilF
MPAKQIYEFGQFRIDPDERLLLREGKPIPLTPKAFETLLALVENSGHVVKKDDLMRRVWPDAFVEEVNLAQNVSALRRALDTNGEQYIETVPKLGYRLIAKARPIRAPRETVDEARLGREQDADARSDPEKTEHEYRFIGSVAPPDSGFDGETDLKRLKPEAESASIAPLVPPASPKIAFTRAKIFVFAIVFAALAGLALYFAFPSGRVIDSIAVLPLVNVASDPNSDYLSEGITDGLINGLSQLPNLTVKSERSVARYKGPNIDPHVVGRELGVRAVLVGKLVPHGDSISIRVELVDARDDNHIWGEEYNRKMADIAGMQEMISKDIAEKLRPKLSGEQKAYIGKPQTQNAEAYALYLKGRFYWKKRTEEGLREGLAYFERAREKDPNYALAYAGLADSYNMLGIWQFVAPREVAPRAKAAALKALELDPLLPEAHASLGMVKTFYEWDWTGGEDEIKEALRLNPSYETAYRWYATILDGTERHEEVIASSRHALELDPTSLIDSSGLGFELYMVRKYDDAVAQLQKTLAMDPNYFPTHHWLSMTYIQKSMPNDAFHEARKAAALSNGSTLSMSDLARSYAVSGNAREARRILQSLQAASKSRYISSFEIATIFASLNESDHAFDSLQKAYEDRDYNLFRLRADPRLESLHKDPRYADLLRRVGLPQ